MAAIIAAKSTFRSRIFQHPLPISLNWALAQELSREDRSPYLDY